MEEMREARKGTERKELRRDCKRLCRSALHGVESD